MYPPPPSPLRPGFVDPTVDAGAVMRPRYTAASVPTTAFAAAAAAAVAIPPPPY